MKKEPTKKELKIEKCMGSANIKHKNFKEDELTTYTTQGDITQKDADLIAIHKVFDWEERNKRIFEKYQSLERS